MGVDPADAGSVEVSFIHQGHDFIVLCHPSLGKRGKETEDFLTVAKGAAGQFPDHKRVRADLILLEQRAQAGVAPPEVIDPD